MHLVKRQGILCFLKRNNEVCLVKVDYGNGKLIWNGVSGFIEPGETSEEAVLREVEEEIGVRIDSSSLLFKGTQAISSNLALDTFIATKWQGNPKPKEESIKMVKWFAIENMPFPEMFANNQAWIPSIIK